MGYRYFDSFRVDVEYPFGYGLSYTEFALTQGTVCVDETSVHTQVTVTNTGDTYKGKEVVQIYVTCPQDGMPKEYKRLCGFAKTDLLAPGESQEISISFPAKAVASFDEENGNWTVEKGLYGVWAGNSSAAITRGVQSKEGVGTTIKHFACNSQEDNRMGSNSILSERILREIYLRGFEIAVKTSQPMAIMTSYNLINGVHAANCKDICTVAARKEWDFQGIIMTDWTTTMPQGGSLSWKCVEAGNDLIMPGWPGDSENIREALKNGSLKREDLQACVKRMLKVIFQTLGYEDCVSYGAQFR